MTTTTELTLADRIHQLVDDEVVQLPALPDLVLELQDALAREDTDVRVVAKLIRSEPAVAASLLRVSNSAAFGGLRPISDLSQAIARLGLRRVESLVTTILLHGTFRANRDSNARTLEILWEHAIASGSACRVLAAREELDVEEMFMAGLLHGIGRLLVLKSVDHLRTTETAWTITPALESELMDTMQCELGHRTLKSWKLADAICAAPLALDPSVDDTAVGNPGAPVVRAADVITRKLGYHPHPDSETELLEQPAIETLALSEEDLGTLLVDLEEVLGAIRGML